MMKLVHIMRTLEFVKKVAHVEPHPDGRYHAHISCAHNAELFEDPLLYDHLKADPAVKSVSFIGAIGVCNLYLNACTEQSFITGAGEHAVPIVGEL